jgi:Fe2+ transport system protein FeoA
MAKMTVIVKRNASYEKGMYGVSIHDQLGIAATVQRINSEAELRERLLAFGLTEGYANDVIGRLKEKHDSVSIQVDRKS